jgi:hypothetical protein
MKPVRRKIRKHYGSTAKKLAVRSQRPWYYRWVLGSIILVTGYGLAYWQYAAGGQSLVDKLNRTTTENQQLQTRVIQVERQIQIEQAAQANLNKALNTAQDENIKIKEDLLFYKNMVSKQK